VNSFEDFNFETPIQYVKGVGPKLSRILEKKGIRTIEDALFFAPRIYEDRTIPKPISKVRIGEEVTLLVRVLNSKSYKIGRKKRFKVLVTDGTGQITLNWFFPFPGLIDEFTPNSMFYVYGKVDFFGGFLTINHPEYEKVLENKRTLNFGRIVPVYSETEGLKQKTIRKIIAETLKISIPHLNDSLPPKIRERLGLKSLRESFIELHFPKSFIEDVSYSEAARRLIFEEFFILQLGLGLKKETLKGKHAPSLLDKEGKVNTFISSLPFSLTNDQKKVVDSIKTDLSKNEPMTRLLQGDVGSGKTVVALIASLIAISENYQVAFMAPTEILAQQHYMTSEKLFKSVGVSVLLLTHSTVSKNTISKISSGEAQLIIGTHALFQKNVRFSRLGLVIVDEQHRFGVDQRNELISKASDFYPHLLMMTATPIPRTLSLTLYGDLELSIIKEKPPGRKPVKTSIIGSRERHELFGKIRKTVQKGEQVYIIYPLIDISDKLFLKSAKEMYEKFKNDIFPDFSIGLIHGKLKPDEKERTLLDFKNGKFNILVSTTVIEVGIDVPNATLMVIEHPERLGLSELHQLRGRVGRGGTSSECILVAEKGVGQRLKIMESTEDGFIIAEEDLKIRGPGEFLGTRQHGMFGFRLGHIVRDAEILELAKKEAQKILKDSSSKEAQAIYEVAKLKWKEKIERLKGG